ncbi:hydroxymethylglutaryl-CoA synthase [Candidatus Woesearchaeota archaeon]|jgi:hydroxymethylglutaryl-CoA synthase|nr:hydroxymethylglutaryl-CoA synthase [Candidatus Woesearchaeota archaeon]
MVKKLNIGIVGFGCYIPKFRIRTEDIAVANNQNVDLIKGALLINEKTVPNKDEDSISIAVEACKNALLRAKIASSRIKAIYMGSESHPYAVKASSAIVGEVLGVGNDFTAADVEFACKAGTAAIQMIAGQVEAEMIDYGLAIGSDTSQGAPGDALEYSAAAGGAAFIIGKNKVGKEESAANILYTLSRTTDTPDFWRRNNQQYPTHMGRFTGEEAYFKHIVSTSQAMLNETGLKIEDFDHVIFHQPNGKFPLKAAKVLGVTNEQLKYGIVVHDIGNTYSGSSLLGLVNVLENALPNQKILLTSYGSGSGSDCFVIETTNLITEKQKIGKNLLNYMQNKQYVNYNQYRQMVKMIH